MVSSSRLAVLMARRCSEVCTTSGSARRRRSSGPAAAASLAALVGQVAVVPAGEEVALRSTRSRRGGPGSGSACTAIVALTTSPNAKWRTCDRRAAIVRSELS